VAVGGDPSPVAAKQYARAATQTIPIVFTASGDPVSTGLVASLNRPGGNVTGVTIFGSDAIAKRVELLRELVPKAANVAYLMNPKHPNAEKELRDAQIAAQSLGQQILVTHASSERDFEAAFATISQRGAQSLLIGDGGGVAAGVRSKMSDRPLAREASPAERQPCRTAGASFTAVRVLGRGRQRA
jgi:putative ABC transport system substrate-binding protein